MVTNSSDVVILKKKIFYGLAYKCTMLMQVKAWEREEQSSNTVHCTLVAPYHIFRTIDHIWSNVTKTKYAVF